MNYSARERFAQLMQSQGQAMAAPMQGTRSNQMMSAVRMANGGALTAPPTLQEMSSPDFQFQGTQLGASAPFTQMNPIVPMFSLEAPAFGGMEQSTYDFTAPVVQGGSLYQPHSKRQQRLRLQKKRSACNSKSRQESSPPKQSGIVLHKHRPKHKHWPKHKQKQSADKRRKPPPMPQNKQSAQGKLQPLRETRITL